MRADLLAPISQAVATLAGAIFVLVGIWYRDFLESRAKRKGSRVQIMAEVQALLDLIQINGYVEGAKRKIEGLKKGGRDYIQFSSKQSFTSVYQANLQNLGYLEDSASLVVRFYMILASSLEDKDMIAVLGARVHESAEKSLLVEPALLTGLLERHEHFLSKILETQRLGVRILADLGRPL
jgi:hypothetical protein